MVRILISIATALSLSGCISNSPRDVSLDSLTVVDFRQQAELPFKGNGEIDDPYSFGGRGFESNVVVIPKAEIIKALEQMPQELKESTDQ